MLSALLLGACSSSSEMVEADPATPVDAGTDDGAVPDSPAAPATADSGVDAAAAACASPGVTLLSALDDSRSLADLATCSATDSYVARCDMEEPVATKCGQAAEARPQDLAKMLAAALPLDPATIAHVRTVFADGKTKGRRPNVFGLVGDSMTVEPSFMTPFGAGSASSVVLAPAVQAALDMGGGKTIIDVFKGVDVTDGGTLDSFRAPRAAKIGVRAIWPLQPDATTGITPLEAMVAELSPAYAFVMYGANDAEQFIGTEATVDKVFADHLRTLVDALEAHGIVPILSTVPKHMREKRFPDCSPTTNADSNTRYMIQTNIVSASAAEVACERHLPLIDFHYAIDAQLDHGVGPDGVHPTISSLGGGVLDDTGLQCGYNARNLVTLRALKLVYEAATAP